MTSWTESDMCKFRSEHPGSDVELWGGFIWKNDGYTLFGYIVYHDHKRFFFDLDGRHIKTKAD